MESANAFDHLCFSNSFRRKYSVEETNALPFRNMIFAQIASKSEVNLPSSFNLTRLTSYFSFRHRSSHNRQMTNWNHRKNFTPLLILFELTQMERFFHYSLNFLEIFHILFLFEDVPVSLFWEEEINFSPSKESSLVLNTFFSDIPVLLCFFHCRRTRLHFIFPE